MEPSLLISIALALGKHLLDLIFCAYNSSSTTTALREELNRFHSKLLVNLSYWEERCADIAAAGFTPKALDNLKDEMLEFVSIAEDLFKKRRLKKEDIRNFQEEVMTAFQWGMTSAVFEVLGEICMELKAERMVEKPAVQITIIHQQDLGNPKLGELLSCVLNTPHATETFQEYLKDVLPSGDGHTSSAASTFKAHSICKSEEEQNKAEIVKQSKNEKLEMTKAAQEKEENRKNNPNFSMSFSSDHVPARGQVIGLSRQDDDGNIEVTLEGQSTEVVSAMIGVRPMKELPTSGIGQTSRAAFNTSEAHSICKSEEEQYTAEKLEMTTPPAASILKENQEEQENRKNNPNLSMSFSSDHVPGKGVQLGLSRQDHDGKIVWTLKGPPDTVSAMIGVRPMKVSEKLHYFYFEVGLLEMAELSGTSKICGYAGVGVGLATHKRFRNDKMVGWYPESFGYDGRVDMVYSEKRPQPFRIGLLVKGDTLGIGLLQLPSQSRPAIFFVKNGVLQGCTQKHGLEQSSIDDLHPVIALASRHAKLCVNFHGPFHLPSGLDLAAALGLT